MNCQEIKNLLHAYSDGELDAAGCLEVERHIQTCPGCKQALENLSVLKSAIATAAPRFKAPTNLRHGILAAARQAAATEQPRATRPWQWNTLNAGLAMAASVMVGFFIALQMNPRENKALPIGELASAHVRSLLATHLMDVVSTDQHTVKPWFDGKLDFAPPVNDLAAKGYPLAGGRLDYIGGRTVAALVYKKEKHFINLFIWPSSGSQGTWRRISVNGYNLINWNTPDMTFWAVSDMNPGDLQEFAEMSRDAAEPGERK